MKWLKLLLVLGILGLWLGATNHCRLEDIPALKFLACNPDGETDTHQNSDCEKDACAAVEKAAYKTEQCRVAVAVPLSFLVYELLPAVEGEPKNLNSAVTAHMSVPELPATWQFFFRAAAPPRAPSFSA